MIMSLSYSVHGGSTPVTFGQTFEICYGLEIGAVQKLLHL